MVRDMQKRRLLLMLAVAVLSAFVRSWFLGLAELVRPQFMWAQKPGPGLGLLLTLGDWHCRRACLPVPKKTAAQQVGGPAEGGRSWDMVVRC